MKRSIYAIPAFFLFSIIYYSVRNLNIEDESDRFLLIILNKAFAWTGIILILFALVGKFLKRSIIQKTLKFYGNLGTILITIHVLIAVKLIFGDTLSVLSADEGNLNIFGELAIISGISAFILLIAFYLHYSSDKQSKRRIIIFRKLKYLLLTAIIFHTVILTSAQLFTEHVRFLPPLSLFVSLMIILTGGILVKQTKKISDDL